MRHLSQATLEGITIIVRMTGRQLGQVCAALSPELRGWLEDEAVGEVVGAKVEVLTIPDAWLAIGEELSVRFTTGSMRRASPALFDGLRRIVRECNRRRAHPAFRGQPVAGRQWEMLPAWMSGRRWQPFVASCDETAFGVLVPRYSRGVTTWAPGDLLEVYGLRGGLYEYETYARFISSWRTLSGSPIITSGVTDSPGAQ